MKAAPFAYVRPPTLDDAIAELAATDGAGKILAGGQSLVPILAMRLGRPEMLVDINAVSELDTLEQSGRMLRIGATVRQRRLEYDPSARAVPLLGMTLPLVGHRELRSRGTVCGSLAHGDPAAELPAVACCLGAQLELSGPAGLRRVSAADFFLGPMTTALGHDEVLSAASFPTASPGEGFGFSEIARRHGDFALAGVVTRVVVTGNVVRSAVISAFGVSDRPITREVTELVAEALNSNDSASLEHALRPATTRLADEIVDTEGDTHGSPAYRRRLLGVLAARELAKAQQSATTGPPRTGAQHD